jgi:hypothetical protein
MPHLNPGFQLKVCVMFLARFFDKIAAALILGMGGSVAAAFSLAVSN